MQTEPNQTPGPDEEAEEKQLCIGCATPNDPAANFCTKCGAPLSSYAATGPFERLFAEGHTYRQAAEQPRNLMTLLGMWMIFGFLGLFGLLLLIGTLKEGVNPITLFFAGFMLVISVAILWKTTRNYLHAPPLRMDE